MNCLWLTRKYPRPANSGELIYSDGLIRSFAATGVNLTVIARDNEEEPVGERFRDDQGVEWRLGDAELGGRVQSLLTRYPSDAWRLKNGGPEATLRKALREEKWDVILIDHAALGWALFVIEEAAPQPRPLIVYLSHNHEAKIRREIARHSPNRFPKSALMRYDAWKYARLENALCARCDLVTAITETEVAAYRESFPEQEYLCLTPGYDGCRWPKRIITADTPRRAIMSGSFEWIAKRINLELFLRETAGDFQREGIELQIVGKAEESFRSSISRQYPGVAMVGRVPEMTPYLLNARVGLVVEEHGGGFKLKQLEYIFHGLPIAGLKKAIDGLPLESPRHLLLTSDLKSLVKAVAGIIDDMDRLNQVRKEAYHICESAFHWESRGIELRRRIEGLRQELALAN